MRNKWFKLIALIVMSMLIITIVTGCQSTSQKQGETAKEPIKIGVLAPMTGKYADYGPKLERGVKYAFSEIDYKIGDIPVELIFEDTASDANIALDKARKFVTNDNIRIALGPVIGAVAMPATKYFAEQQIPHIMWAAQAKEIFDAGWTGSVNPTCVGSTYFTGKYACEELGKKATVIAADYISGYNFAGGAIMGFEDAGGTIVQKQWVPTGTVDFGPYLAALEPADVTFFWFPGAMNLLFIKQYKEFGLAEKQPLSITYAGTLWQEQLDELREDAVGLIGATQYTPMLDTPVGISFKEGYKKMWGVEPDDYDCSAYEIALLAIKSLEKSDGKASGEELLADMKSVEIDAPGGSLKLHTDMYGVRPQHIVKVELVDGKPAFNIVKSYDPLEEDIILKAGITPAK